MIEAGDTQLSISSQCDLLGVPRSNYYYQSASETEYNLQLMKEIDVLYLENPSFGSRLMVAALQRKGFVVNRKRVVRLMQLMGIEALYQKPKVRTSFPGNIRYPYLLKNIIISCKNQVWGTDITYIPVEGSFLYLVAFLDLHSRYVLSWKISKSLESNFCLEALEDAFLLGKPDIINSDQGVQYTSRAYTDLVKSKGVEVSMSGRGKCWDNIFVERFWRTLKYEEVHPNRYENNKEAEEGISSYIEHYNKNRPHSALKYSTPEEVYLNV